jgi:hypothetical protein
MSHLTKQIDPGIHQNSYKRKLHDYILYDTLVTNLRLSILYVHLHEAELTHVMARRQSRNIKLRLSSDTVVIEVAIKISSCKPAENLISWTYLFYPKLVIIRMKIRIDRRCQLVRLQKKHTEISVIKHEKEIICWNSKIM